MNLSHHSLLFTLNLHDLGMSIYPRIFIHNSAQGPLPSWQLWSQDQHNISFLKVLTTSVHFGRVFSIGKYSLNHLDYTRQISSWTLRHLYRGLNLVVSTLSGANCPAVCSCKKLLGVNGTSSFMFAD